MSNLTTIITTGLHNPDCAFYTGAFVGQWLAVKYLVLIWLIYAVFKAIDKIAFEPLLEWTKKKIFRGKKK